mgnify:CR=1 FL=1
MWNTEKFKSLIKGRKEAGQFAIDRVIFDLTSVNGNVFSLMGNFKSLARRQGWNSHDIQTVLDECITSDYDHAVQTLLAVTTTEDELDDESTENYDDDFDDYDPQDRLSDRYDPTSELF